MSIQLEALTTGINALEASVARAVPEVAAGTQVPQLQADLKAAQDALAASQAAEAVSQQQIDALTQRIAALTAQLPAAPAA